MITLIVVVIVATFGYLEYRNQQRTITRISARNAQILATTIQNSIENVMMSGQSDEVTRILTRLKTHEAINSLTIFDENGRILNSSDKREIGGQVDVQELEAYRKGNAIHLHNRGNHQQFHSISLIYNRPACQGCHDAGQVILGALEIELPIDYLQADWTRAKALP